MEQILTRDNVVVDREIMVKFNNMVFFKDHCVATLEKYKAYLTSVKPEVSRLYIGTSEHRSLVLDTIKKCFSNAGYMSNLRDKLRDNLAHMEIWTRNGLSTLEILYSQPQIYKVYMDVIFEHYFTLRYAKILKNALLIPPPNGTEYTYLGENDIYVKKMNTSNVAALRLVNLDKISAHKQTFLDLCDDMIVFRNKCKEGGNIKEIFGMADKLLQKTKDLRILLVEDITRCGEYLWKRGVIETDTQGNPLHTRELELYDTIIRLDKSYCDLQHQINVMRNNV